MPKRKDIKKVMVIGSGPIVIGQAAEFDYAGTQACLALKEEGYEVILVNSNPATIMTDTHIADKVYMEPLTLEYVAKIIRYERPDAIVPGLGGQTGLNLAVQLAKKGILQECQVEILGTSFESIERAEDRELFKELCESLGEPVIESQIAMSVEEAAEVAHRIGYPVVLRPAFTLGGTGGGFADDEAELRELMRNALAVSPVHQVLIEKSIKGYKEIEYRGDARPQRHGHLHLLHGEHRPRGRPYRRLDRRGSEPDAHQQGVPDAARLGAETHPRVEDRGRLQRAVRTGPPLVQILPDRGQPPRVALLGPGVEGYGLSDRPRQREDRRGSDARRDPHRQHAGIVRTDAGLRGDEGRPLPLRQILRRFEQARHADEGHGRGDVDRPYDGGVAC